MGAMEPTLVTRLLLVAILLAAGVGVLDGVVDQSWDHVALFTVTGVLGGVLVLRSSVGRRCVAVRTDLMRWLLLRSELSGERIGAIADRALWRYRAEIGDDRG